MFIDRWRPPTGFVRMYDYDDRTGRLRENCKTLVFIFICFIWKTMSSRGCNITIVYSLHTNYIDIIHHPNKKIKINNIFFSGGSFLILYYKSMYNILKFVWNARNNFQRVCVVVGVACIRLLYARVVIDKRKSGLFFIIICLMSFLRKNVRI